MMLIYLIHIAIGLWLLSIMGYFLVVMKEKYYLKNHIVLIDHKDLEPEVLKNIDIKHFMLGSTEVMAGDEVKIQLENTLSIKGTVLGVIKAENSIALITRSQGVKNLKVNSIKKLKVISRYGKFFSRF
ncbi:hypothetical protein [Alkaliphilus crotonatoxidans]